MGTTTVTGTARTRVSSNTGAAWKRFVAQTPVCMHPAGARALHARAWWPKRGLSPFSPAS